MKIRSRFRAATLSYAIMFLFLTGLFCSTLLFLFSAYKRMEVLNTMEDHLVFDNLFALHLGANMFGEGSIVYPHPAGDSSIIYSNQWGLYKAVAVTTFFKQSSINQAVLACQTYIKENNLTLWIAEQNKSVKIGGDTKIIGSFFGPSSGVERANIPNMPFMYSEFIDGKSEVSSLFLPTLRPQIKDLTYDKILQSINYEFLNELPEDFNRQFGHSTYVYTTDEPLLIDHTLAGNIIIHSNSSIVIKSSAKLSNIMICSPIIEIEEGFNGELQLVGSDRIVINKNVVLSYPSSIIFHEHTENTMALERGVFLKEGAMVVGGVIATSSINDYKRPILLSINKAIVGGIIYNTGNSDLRGAVYGTTYSAKVIFESKGKSYGNHIVDHYSINKELPKGLIIPSILQEDTEVKSKIAKWL